MSIFSVISGSLRGGWKTHGPNQIRGAGAFDSGDDSNVEVNAEMVLRLAAAWACLNIRAETAGSLPCHLRDGGRKIIKDHPLYNILHRSPNADMTAVEFWSLATAQVDLHGNSVSIIERIGKKVVALTPVDIGKATVTRESENGRKVWRIGGEEHKDSDILHLRGFSTNDEWGASRLAVGNQILSSQLAANRSALLAFKQGLKVGGFFLNEGKRDFTTEELKDFAARLNFFGRGENAGKWMTLQRGMKPIAGTEFSVKPAEAQLLESRYFGIEEICRLFNVPPPLIGHTSKASSWASSLENLNLHFISYSLAPTLIRMEQRIEKQLLTPEDYAKGVQCKFSLSGLLRGDTKTRQAFYASGLQNGYLCQNEVRAFEDMPGIGPEGDVYRVQLNMAGSEDAGQDNNEATRSSEDDTK